MSTAADALADPTVWLKLKQREEFERTWAAVVTNLEWMVMMTDELVLGVGATVEEREAVEAALAALVPGEE